MLNNFFFFEICGICEIMWKNILVRQATDDDITLRMRFACWIVKTTNTHSEYVIVILFQGNNGYVNAP